MVEEMVSRSTMMVANNNINYITKFQLRKTVALLNPDYNMKNRDVFYVSVTIFAAVFLFAMSVSNLSESPSDHHTGAVTDVYAQPYVETVKHRNLTIDLGNGLKTYAQLTIPAVGEGPFPGVTIFPGAGAGSVFPSTSPYSHMAEYLSERGMPFLDLISEEWGRISQYQIIMHGAILHLTI
jgi:hypothetical protein